MKLSESSATLNNIQSEYLKIDFGFFINNQDNLLNTYPLFTIRIMSKNGILVPSTSTPPPTPSK